MPTMPETKDNDFTWKDFQSRNTQRAGGCARHFVNRALVLTNKYFDGKVPPQVELTDADRETLEEIPRLKEAVEYNLDNFRSARP